MTDETTKETRYVSVTTLTLELSEVQGQLQGYLDRRAEGWIATTSRVLSAAEPGAREAIAEELPVSLELCAGARSLKLVRDGQRWRGAEVEVHAAHAPGAEEVRAVTHRWRVNTPGGARDHATYEVYWRRESARRHPRLPALGRAARPDARQQGGLIMVMKRIPSPYGFVPIEDHVVTPPWGQLANHDVLLEAVSGRLDVEITLKTDAFFRSPDDPKESFKLPDGRYAIPGASLRGALRNAVEIACAAGSRCLTTTGTASAICDGTSTGGTSESAETPRRRSKRAG